MIFSQTMEVETCCNCHIAFGITEDFKKARLKDRENFHCPRGHQMHYLGKSEEQRLRESLQEEQHRSQALRESAAKLERANRKLKKRAAAGVCPCCNRTVQQMARHMKTKHPEFVTKV